MKNTNKIILAMIILAVIVIGGMFYWFQLRPTQIKKECYKLAEDGKLIDTIKKYAGESYFDEKIYNKCLLEHGLSK